MNYQNKVDENILSTPANAKDKASLFLKKTEYSYDCI